MDQSDAVRFFDGGTFTVLESEGQNLFLNVRWLVFDARAKNELVALALQLLYVLFGQQTGIGE